jgi:NADPH-dependent F420 reductase
VSHGAPKSVAVLGGTGKEGRGLALRWAKAGIEVFLGSRDADRAAATAREISEVTGGRVQGDANAAAAASAEVSIMATPYEGMAATLDACHDALRGKLLVSAVVPMRVTEGRFSNLELEHGSAAEEAAWILPESRLAAAFHTVSSSALAKLDHDLGEDVPVAADEAADRETVAALCAAIGLRAVAVGPLSLARYLEGMTPVIVSLNRLNRVNAGIRFTLPGA